MSAAVELPLMSIVVPSFNQGRFLPDALRSILDQDYPRLEVVVMDGGSSDDSVAIIESFAARLTYWQSHADGGQAAAINAGMQHCHGEIVAWLNSDDFYCDDALWTVARAYRQHPGHGLYIGNGFRYDNATQQRTPFCTRHVALNREALVHGIDYILQPSTFFLHSAWKAVGGLAEHLAYTLDWDLIMRIAERYPAVTINEFLAASREYADTKTSRGQMERAFEIARTVRARGGGEASPGTLYYLLETLLGVTDDATLPTARAHFYAAFESIRGHFALRYGHRDGFPERGDPQDHAFLPLACRGGSRGRRTEPVSLPAITVITPSFNQAPFLGAALDSVIAQEYPRTEMLVFDAASQDGSVDVIRDYAPHLAHWESVPDRGPAHAINKGFARATGDVIGWLNSDDLLADDALSTVGRTFAEDPALDLVYGNALYIDERTQLRLADHGAYRTAVYRGEMQPLERIPAYWSYVHAVPQPTVFFRRRLLERCGGLDESYHFIFDFELFWRFARQAKVKKIERTLAFYRLHPAAKTTDWNKFLVELYRASRPAWPPVWSPQFRSLLRDFLATYSARRFGDRPPDWWLRAARGIVAAAVVSGFGNPESFRLQLPPPRIPRVGGWAAAQAPASTSSPEPLQPHRVRVGHGENGADPRRYHSLFHSYFLPRFPGHFGGEMRDFHLLRHLLSFSHVEFYASMSTQPDERENYLANLLDASHTPETIAVEHPELVDHGGMQARPLSRWASELRRRQIPILGPRYHLEAVEKLTAVRAYSCNVLREQLRHDPDFFFVSPQTNPVALTLPRVAGRTRWIMASYDVEVVRMQRLAQSQWGIARLALALEVNRAARFEERNLGHYDGVLAVSELDRRLFVETYGLPAERVLVVENGVDLDYFAFNERQARHPPVVLFVGTFSYQPNEDGARRLLDRIMPLVRREHPDALLALVGQGASPALLERNDGRHVEVTGPVDDVRPWLARAAVTCVPLRSGSGTKYKVLEAMSAGVPLVCSPVALEGLEVEAGTHVAFGESDEEIAAAVIQLLNDPGHAAALAGRARAQVERRYGWDAALAPLAEWLAHIAALPVRGT